MYFLGDISFEGACYNSPDVIVFSKIKKLWTDPDFVVGNLESPLLAKGTSTPGKCALKGDPGWADILRNAGIKLVSLANNHMMDYGPQGLFSTIEVLKKNKIAFIGAGENLQKAQSPFCHNINDIRYAFLARSSVIVSSPCYASEKDPGVAFLDFEETQKTIQRCRENANYVVLLIHWGLENYHYPPIKQRELAKKLIDAGADLIVGHHPHVLQGAEKFHKGVVFYSLGNCVFDDVHWSFVGEEDELQNRTVKLREENRESGVLKVDFNNSGIKSWDFLPTYIKISGIVDIQNSSLRKKQFNRLCNWLDIFSYSSFWRFYSIKQEWRLRMVPLFRGKLKLSKLQKIRPKHFRQLIEKVNRSAKITSEKSVDPYGGPTKKSKNLMKQDSSTSIGLLEAEDEQQLLNFMEQGLKDNGRFRSFWKWRQEGKPHSGGETAVVAKVDEKLTGSIGIVPAKITFGGSHINASWQQDTLVAKSMRGKGLGKRLVNKGAEGWDMVMAKGTNKPMYGLRKALKFEDAPNPTHLIRVSRPRLGANSFKDKIIECILSAYKSILPWPKTDRDIKLSPQNDFDNSFDTLADKIAQENILRVYKNAGYLNWRYAGYPHKKYTILKAAETETRGAIVVNICGDTGDEGWIVDLVCGSDDTQCAYILLKEAITYLEANGASRIWAFATLPAARKWLCRCGFLPTNRTPRFTFRIENKKLDSSKITNVAWDFWHGDGDLELYQ